MKKFLSVILSIAMIASMAVVSMAAGVAQIGSTTYGSLAEALEAAEGMTGDVVIELLGDVEWETGAGHGSTPFISAESKVTSLTINGNDKTLTAIGEGVGSIRAANGALLTFNDLKVVDKSVSYAESSWEFTYLEFAGNLKFNSVDFQNGIQLDTDNGTAENVKSTFKNCTFTTNEDSVYGVWVGHGDVSFENCTFSGTRGAKLHECYGSDIYSVAFEGCTFKDISKKPGIAIGGIFMNGETGTYGGKTWIDESDTSISITGCTFENVQPGDQGQFVYETDTEIDSFDFTRSGSKITIDSAALQQEADNLPEGTYNWDVAGKTVSGYDSVDNGNGTWTIKLSEDSVIETEAPELTTVDSETAAVLGSNEAFENVNVNEPAEVQDAMIEATINNYEIDDVDDAEIKSVLLDVAVTITENGITREATPADFAANGGKFEFRVPLEDLEGAKRTDTFLIMHVITKSGNNNVAGDIEYVKGNVEVGTDKDYVVFELSGCSPVLILWSGSINPVTSGGEGITLYGPYIYDAAEDTMKTEAEAKADEKSLEYGEPVYCLIWDDKAESVLYDRDFVEKLKVKANWNMGGSVVESVKVVKKYVNVNGNRGLDCAQPILNSECDSGYYYFLEINTADKKGIAETDVEGVIEFNRKANSKKGVQSIKDCKVDVDFTVFYPHNWINDGQIEGDRADLEWETPYALKFNNDDEVELSFGSDNGGNNEGTFTVDVSGQGKVFLEYTTEADEAIAAANEGAKLYFITFNGVNGVGVKFNRTGEFRYEMEDAAYAYEVVDGKLAPIAGLEVEDDEFVFNTNVLKAYVFSDTELNQPA